jgi:hypothetical protein
VSSEGQILELEKQRTALMEKLQDGQDFWEDFETSLNAYGAKSLSELPADLRQAITEKLADLPSESQLEAEIAKLDEKEAELLSLVERRLRHATPSLALLLSLTHWRVLLDLLNP